MSIDHTKQQLFELAKKIEFFRNSMDEDTLVAKIERELGTITGFAVEYTTHAPKTRWWYTFKSLPKHTTDSSTYTYDPTRLQALYDELILVTKD